MLLSGWVLFLVWGYEFRFLLISINLMVVILQYYYIKPFMPYDCFHKYSIEVLIGWNFEQFCFFLWQGWKYYNNRILNLSSLECNVDLLGFKCERNLVVNTKISSVLTFGWCKITIHPTLLRKIMNYWHWTCKRKTTFYAPKMCENRQ